MLGRALAGIGAVCLIMTFTPVPHWAVNALAGEWSEPSGDVLVVLGGSPSTNDRIIGRSTYWRSLFAVRAWHAQKARRIVVCGGRGVAEAMREFMLSQGVPASAITLEPGSNSTHQNAARAAALVGNTRVVLMTSDIHMFRAVRVFRKAGIAVEPYPVPDSLWQVNEYDQYVPNRWGVFVDIAVEAVKIGVYAVRGWV